MCSKARNVLILLFLLTAAGAEAGQVELVSRAVPGSSPDTGLGLSATNGYPDAMSIEQSRPRRVSADGRWVVFTSEAANLVAGQLDANFQADVFLRDQTTGTTVLVSRSTAGATTAGNFASFRPSLSSDGRFVAFLSRATNLVPNQVDTAPGFDQEDVFLFDRVAQTTVLVSRAAGTTATGTGHAYADPLVSDDGARVAFVSWAGNLVPGQSQEFPNGLSIFLFQSATGAVSLVSHPAGNPSLALLANHGFSLSADGRWVAFFCGAANVVAGQNGPGGLFLHDAESGESVSVSHVAGAPTTTATVVAGPPPSISADGNRVAFASTAEDLVTGVTDDPDTVDVFLWERTTDTTTLVSHAHASPSQAVGGQSPVISGDGSTVAFIGFSADLLPAGGVVVASSVFRYVAATGVSSLASPAAGSTTHSANAQSFGPVLSFDGHAVLFRSAATDLVTGQIDTALTDDLFFFDANSGTTTLVDHTSGSTGTPVPSGEFWGSELAGGPFLSADGRWAAFSSTFDDIQAGLRDFNQAADVFLYDRQSEANVAVSVHAVSSESVTPWGESWVTGLSADGRWVLFLSTASNVVAGASDPNGSGADVFLFDRTAQATILVSHAAGSPLTTSNGAAVSASLSGDGRWIALVSSASDLVSGQNDGNGADDVFLYDRTTGDAVLVSHAAGSLSTAGNAGCTTTVISRDGSRVAFACTATDLIFGQVDGNNGGDVFLYDRATGGTSLSSHAQGSAVTAGNSAFNEFAKPALSADGRFVAFESAATDLVAGQIDGNSGTDVFLNDGSTGAVTLVSRAHGTAATTANARSALPVLSADGRFLAFTSPAGDLIAGQGSPGGNYNVYLWDRVANRTALVSHAAGAPLTPCNRGASVPSIDDQGRFVVFDSDATNLVPGQIDMNNFPFESTDVFLWDRVADSTALVSHIEGSAVQTGSSLSYLSAVSSDGNYVGFWSQAPDLLSNIPLGGYLFRYRRATGAVSVAAQAITSNAPATSLGRSLKPPLLSQAGHELAFTSGQSNLVDLDFNARDDAFALSDPPIGRDYFSLSPCRLLDTRRPQDGPALSSGTSRLVGLAGACGIPATAKAVALNVTVLNATGAGYLALYPGDQIPPSTSSINFAAGALRANNTIVALSEDGQQTLRIKPLVGDGGTVHVVVDVMGYFE